jgi:hypothetical protein
MRLHAKVFVFAIVLSVWGAANLRAGEPAADPSVAPLTAQEVAARMEAKGRERALALRAFEASRVYHLEYWGFGGNKEAELKVRMNFRAPATKTFKVISQDGSKFIIEHVFNRLLQSEQEALDDQNRQATALTLENYEFSLSGYEEQADGGHAYVLDVKPRNKNKFLYVGKIWVNAQDFAVERIEAEPAKSPSFWIKKTQIEHRYIKVGNFWLPAQNRSESQIRLGGRALLTIDYNDYRITSATTPGTADQAATTSSPDRSQDRPGDGYGAQKTKKSNKTNPHRQFGASDAALADALNIPK